MYKDKKINIFLASIYIEVLYTVMILGSCKMQSFLGESESNTIVLSSRGDHFDTIFIYSVCIQKLKTDNPQIHDWFCTNTMMWRLPICQELAYTYSAS